MPVITPRITSEAAAVAAVLGVAERADLPMPTAVSFGLGRPTFQMREVDEVAAWADYLETTVVDKVSIADPVVRFHEAEGSCLELAVRVFTTTRTEATA